MTVCDVCGKLAMNTLKTCHECKEIQAEFNVHFDYNENDDPDDDDDLSDDHETPYI